MTKASTPDTPAKPTFREILEPLATTALQTSMAVYQWGLENKALIRAANVMQLCESVIRECNQMLALDTKAFEQPKTGAKKALEIK